jgi:hypothetical protein
VVDGVVEDVLEGALVLLLRLDVLRPEALSEDVVFAAVAAVEGAGVLAVEVAHALGEVRERRLDDEVVVVAEKAAGVEAPAVAPLDATEDLEEDGPVTVVEEDRRVVVPLRADVVVRAGLEVAMRASHAATVARPPRSNRPVAAFGTPPLRTLRVPGTNGGTGGPGRRPKRTGLEWTGGF